MNHDRKTHDVIECLETAFAPVPYPGDDRLLARDCLAGRHLRDALRGCTPEEVPDDLIERHYDGLALLSGEARRYYLPAFARTALRRPESDVGEFLLYALGSDLPWQPDGGFTGSQLAAIVGYLKSLPGHMDRVFHAQIADTLAQWQAKVRLILVV